MSNKVKESDVTIPQIVERLEQLGVEFDPKAKKAELLKLLNDAIQGSESSGNDSKSNKVKESDVRDGSLTKAQLRPAQVRGKDTLAISESVRDLQEQRKADRIQRLLSTKGYHWYLCEARTVLRDGRVCRRGYYYPIHEDEVATLGTFQFVDPEKKDKNGQPVVETRPRFKKETPEEGLTQEELENEVNANDWIG